MRTRRASGFSLTELVVAMAVAMILMAVALPAFLRAYHSYQLSNAATQMADIVRLTRYEAIRLNKTVNCVIRPDTTDPTMTDASMTDVRGIPLTGPSSRVAFSVRLEIWWIRGRCRERVLCPLRRRLAQPPPQPFRLREARFNLTPAAR